MIGILDFGSAGNVRSVANAFARAGARTGIVKTYDADRSGLGGLVVPGVGSFSVVPGMVSALGGRGAAGKIGVPVLCICLGMQSMLESSEESDEASGLGIVRGKVKRIRGSVRLPQLGWNQVALAKKDPLFDGVANNEYFYFANSYAAFPQDGATVLATTKYGQRFASAVRKGNWWGVQFHPEKSGKAGQRLIGNFAEICSKGW